MNNKKFNMQDENSQVEIITTIENFIFSLNSLQEVFSHMYIKLILILKCLQILNAGGNNFLSPHLMPRIFSLQTIVINKLIKMLEIILKK